MTLPRGTVSLEIEASCTTVFGMVDVMGLIRSDALETIGEIKDDLSTGRYEGEGMGEDILLAGVALKVVGAPVGAVGSRVALDDAIVAGDAALLQSSAYSAVLLDILIQGDV